ncbi:MAG: hypothetical protein AAF458_00150 [Pseudomonadota bacterium]
MRRYEAIVDAARERTVADARAPAPNAGPRTVGTLFSALLWWFWLYAALHIVVYVPILGAPGLGFEETSAYVAPYLESFDVAIAWIALGAGVLGSVAGWLPGSEPGLFRTGRSMRRTGPVIVRNVVIGKVVSSAWAAVFVVPLEVYSDYGIVFVGTGLWAIAAAVVTLIASNIGRWFLIVALVLDLGGFGYLAYQLYNDAAISLPLVQVLAIAGFMLATITMMSYLLVSTRVNRFFGT